MESVSELAGYTPNIYHFLALGVAAFALSYVQSFFTVPKDRHEPPLLHSSIPWIGHLVRFYKQGADYYLELERRYHQSLYTLLIGSRRMYIATSPEWTQAIHKSYKSLRSGKIVAMGIKNVFLFDQPGMEVIDHNVDGEDGTREGLVLEMHDMLASVLAPGPALDDLNRSILSHVLPDVNQLAQNGSQRIDLWVWIRHHFSIASMKALWGSNNPFEVDPTLEPAFWDFEVAIIALSMVPLPWLLARKGYQARKRLFEGFAKYINEGHYNDPDTSQLVKNRFALDVQKHGLTKQNHAQGELSMVFGALVNTIPAGFWLISQIFADPALLSEIRKEIDNCVSTPADDGKKRVLNATKLRASCPLLASALREILRITASVNITRLVHEDFTITNSKGESALLKKDAIVQVASNVIHQNKDLWGSDAKEFNARRFAQQQQRSDASTTTSTKIQDPAAPYRDAQGKVHSAAFRSFGGGNNICPGRWFAQTEILGLASLFVAGFEVESVESPGAYRLPAFEDVKTGLAVLKPKGDVSVTIRRRAGYEDVEWTFEM